jgi:hypothetical protein
MMFSRARTLAQGSNHLVRGLADAKPKTMKPPKDQVRQRLEDVKKYKDEMHKLRSSLVKSGMLNESPAKVRERRIEEGKIKTGRKYTPEEKQKRIEDGKQRHDEYVAKSTAEAEKRHRSKILNVLVRRRLKESHEAVALSKAQYELAQDIEATWGKAIKEDLKLVVPVNAPFLGVLPRKHAPVAQAFADELYKIRQMYGPPKPLPPSENMYNGVDPRIAEFTSSRPFFPRPSVGTKA